MLLSPSKKVNCVSLYLLDQLTRAQQALLEEKKETIVTNLDKSAVNFSKKHSILVSELLNDFYTIKCRRPITDEKVVVQVFITTSSPEIQVEPSQLSLDIR